MKQLFLVTAVYSGYVWAEDETAAQETFLDEVDELLESPEHTDAQVVGLRDVEEGRRDDYPIGGSRTIKELLG